MAMSWRRGIWAGLEIRQIRPTDALMGGASEIETISEANRRAFEGHEREFQDYRNWPGLPARPVVPTRVLEAR